MTSDRLRPFVRRTLDRLRPFVRRTFGSLAACLAFLIFAGPALHAQTLTVFDDVLQNGFADYSFGGGTDFAATGQVHSGTKSVSILGHSFNALSFEHAPSGVITTLHTSITPILRFWVNGGTSSGQQFHIGFQLNNVRVGTLAALDTYITGGSVGLGVWRAVSIDLRQAPFNVVDFDRIDIQSDEDATHTDLSATYFDDLVLGQPTGTVVSAIQYGQGVTVENMSSETFTWQDSLGHPRFAALAYNDAGAFNGSQGGALREYKFQLTNGQTRTATSTTYGNGGYGGFGYVTDHSSRYVGCVGGDDSPLGFAFAGHWQRVFEGKHHAIFRFTQNYQRYCPTTGPVITRYLPVTIDWMFTTGHDHPLWAITYDVDLISDGVNPPVAADTYYDDSRAPYGELNIDGDGFTYDINGTSWGDRYKFIPTNAAGTSMTLNVPWNWTTTNTVPWVKEWIDAALGAGPYNGDATMGIVQTQTLTQQDAGGARDPGVGSDITPYWTKTDANGIHSAGPNKVPNGDNWRFQANGDNLTGAAGNNNARLTWKTQYGFIGQTSYTMNNGVGTTAPGYPKKSYSTYIVLGQHSVVPDPVDAQVTQVETVQSLTLTTNGGIGSVVTTGPAGNTNSTPFTYAPPGYNHVYGALAFQASGNALDANVNVGSGTLNKPLMIVSNYTSASEPVVMLGGTTLVADTDYFDSLRPSANELWITFNSNFAGATNHIQIQAPGGISAPTNVVATAASSTSVAVTWTAVGGAASYTVYRSSNNSTYTSVGTPATNSFTDTTASANTAYLYKVTATGAGTSGDSNKDLATTVIPTNASLTAQRIKAVDITELRTAVNAVRKLANGGVANDFSFIDPTLTVHSTVVKRIHVIDLRTALDAARSTLGLSALSYTDSTITIHSTPVKAIHLTDLRNGVK